MRQQCSLKDGTTVTYYTYHDDQQPTVVMIHGITGNHKGFQYILPELSGVRCIVPDLPGFGNSDLPPRSTWSIDGLAALANEFVEQLRLSKPPIILGHSMGGLVVSSMVSQRPDLYDERVVLISPVPTAVRRFESRTVGAKLGSLQYRLGHSTGKAGDRLVKSKLVSHAATKIMMRTSDSDRRHAIYAHHLDNLTYFSDSKFYHALHNDINRHGSIDYAEALRAKTVLLIAGDRDNVTPLGEMTKFANAIVPEQYVIIPHVGHLIHYEKAPEAASTIAQFVDR